MDSLDMVKGDKFSLRGYFASIFKDDPRKCWPFQELIDYHEFKLLEGSTPGSTKVQSNQKGKEAVSKNPAETNVQRKRNREGNESGSENSAGGNANDIDNNLTFDVEEDSDCDLTVREFVSKVKGLNIKKNKNKRKALEVEEPGLFVAEPQPTGSSGRLNLSGSVSVAGVGETRVQAPTMALAKPRPASSSDGLMLLSSVAMMLEKRQPDGSSGGLQPPGLLSRMREPVVGIGGARVQAPEIAPAGPHQREVMVCRVSRNPAEFSTEHAKLFLRSL